MKTSGSFGFISYNSRAFLLQRLQKLIEAKIFSRSACWYHESLGTEKSHFHCWVEPVGQVETSNFANMFDELDENGNKQSIAIRPKCKSDWNNAYLYGIHDSDYLDYKGLLREEVNIKTDQHIYIGDFTADIAQAEYYRFKSCLAPYARIQELVKQGATLEEIYIKLRIPFAQLHSVKSAYLVIKRTLKAQQTDRFEKIDELPPFTDIRIKFN